MAVKIRLTRRGRNKRPFYRIVVTDSRSPRDGRFIESLGIYNPLPDPPEIRVSEERALYWLEQGAIPSDTVKNLLRREGILHKRFLMKRGFDEARLAEEMKKWEVLQLGRRRKDEALRAEKAKATVKETVETEGSTGPEAEVAPERPVQSDVVGEARAESMET